MGFVIISLCKTKMVCIARLPFLFPEAEIHFADALHWEFHGSSQGLPSFLYRAELPWDYFGIHV